MKSQIPPLASKPGAKIIKNQTPQNTVPKQFDETLALFQSRTREWSEEFNNLMNNLATARKVTYPL
jgi:hypothetical protein